MRVDIVLTDDLLALHRSGQQIIGSGLEEADLIFRSGTVNRFHPNKPMLGIGHVGVYVSPGVVIHASPHAAGRIAPSSIAWFLDADFSKYRGTRRIIADP